MTRKILVAYASKYGATHEIAEKIGAVLRKAEFQVDVLPVKSIGDLTSYQAVILGSAVYIGSWPKEAAAFLQANEKSLSDRPVWIFSSGPTGEGDAVDLLEGWRLPAALRPAADRIHPRDIAVFHGYINPEKMNFIEKLVVKNMVKKPIGDFRDWNAIITWTETVAAALNDTEPRVAEQPIHA